MSHYPEKLPNPRHLSYDDQVRLSRYLPADRIVEVGFAAYPNRWAVSPKRADELRAEWQAITAAWLDKQEDWNVLDEWAETFAPEHPEWFSESSSTNSAVDVRGSLLKKGRGDGGAT